MEVDFQSMNFINVSITTTAVAVGACAAGLYYLFLYKRSPQQQKKTTQILKIPPGEVIFFNGSNVYCRRNCITRKKKSCGENCSLTKMMHIARLIHEAQSTIDICIYLITCNELSDAIVKAHCRGCKVRVIVDEEMSTCSESKTSWFRGAGIPIRSKKTSNLMHHKFCIIDYALLERKLLTGSLNWTLQGLAGNYEHVTITSHPVPVLEYQKEFNRLWSEFSVKK